MKDNLNIKQTYTNINIKYSKFNSENGKSNEDEEKSGKIKKKLNLIEEYLFKYEDSSKIIINPIKLESLFSEIEDSLSKSIKMKIESKLCENILRFKKSDMKKLAYPILLNFLKPVMSKLEKELKKNEFSYFIFRLLESIQEFKDKLYNIYKEQLTRFEINSNIIIKKRISNFVKFSYEYNDFLNQYTNWHVKSETIMLNMYILSKYYNKNYNFSSEKFNLDSNMPFDINEFIKYYFLDLSVIFLKNINLSLYLFGSLNYTRIILLLLSNYYSGMSIPSIFFSSYSYTSIIFGTYILNWIVNYFITFCENKKNLEKFIRMSKVLHVLNEKIDSIQDSSSDLINYLILFDLSQQVISNCDYDKKDVFLKDVNEKFILQKLDELSGLITMHISKVDGISKEDMKKIKIESVKWIEKIVKIEKNDEENGQSVLVSCMKEEEFNKDDWVLIEMINDYVKES